MKDLLHYLFVIVWLINGVYCKLLNQVPRHGEIIAKLLSREYADEFRFIIGCSEIMMAAWILSKIKTPWCAWSQIIIILMMNIIEFCLASELLLWGKLNLVFAILFSILIYFYEFKLNRNV